MAFGKVGVRADDLRVLAAQLEHGALHPPRAFLADPAADLDRAGEEDLRRRSTRPAPGRRAAAVDGPHQSLRKTGALEDLLDALADQRRQRGRLQHDAVARHQRDRDLAERDRPRIVPGGDHAHDADRLVHELALLLLQHQLASWGSARRRGSAARCRRTSAARRWSAAAPSCRTRGRGLPCSRVSSSAISSEWSRSTWAARRR